MKRRLFTTRQMGLGLLVAGTLAYLATGADADGSSETVTAWTHANLAAQASDVAGVHMHLHHALNCLVGPGGSGFDAKEMNPCANAGNGAIPDTADPAAKKTLQAAADKAKTGIAAADLGAARKIASDTATMLKSH